MIKMEYPLLLYIVFFHFFIGPLISQPALEKDLDLGKGASQKSSPERVDMLNHLLAKLERQDSDVTVVKGYSDHFTSSIDESTAVFTNENDKKGTKKSTTKNPHDVLKHAKGLLKQTKVEAVDKTANLNSENNSQNLTENKKRTESDVESLDANSAELASNKSVHTKHEVSESKIPSNLGFEAQSQDKQKTDPSDLKSTENIQKSRGSNQNNISQIQNTTNLKASDVQNSPQTCSTDEGVDTDESNDLEFDDESQKSSSDSESTRSMLIKLQKILLVVAGVTFLCILIYSIYYINLIRSIYSKERVVK